MTTQQSKPRRLVVLGSTGSIGVNTLTVVEHLNATGADSIKVVGLAAGTRVDTVIAQARQFQVPNVALADANPARLDTMRKALPGVRLFAGPHAAQELMDCVDATDLSAAIVGSAGLGATVTAARKGMTIGLANKETLVAAGELVAPIVKKHNARLIPVDSEHSAIFQCLEGHRTQHPDGVKRIVLTASGGPFRTTPKKDIYNATVEQALKHPTWTMGRKITIDSATMMNKALEIIEAHWLFDLPAEKIDVIIHPQSVIHSFVEYADNSVLAQLGPPDMKTPIQYALTYPGRAPGCSKALDWSGLRQLDFEPPDFERFPSLKLAYAVIRAGGTAGAVFNAANEAAVAAFLDRKIPFGRIVELVGEAVAGIPVRHIDTLETVMEADVAAREHVSKSVGYGT